MRIEEGKYYRTRDGRKVGPMIATGNPHWPFKVRTPNGFVWYKTPDQASYGDVDTDLMKGCALTRLADDDPSPDELERVAAVLTALAGALRDGE